MGYNSVHPKDRGRGYSSSNRFDNDNQRNKFSEESTRKHWETVTAAVDLAKFYNEQRGANDRIDKSDPEYQKRFDRLSKALNAQSVKEKSNTIHFVQRKIVAGELEHGLGALHYLEKSYVPTTKAFAIAYQAISERDLRQNRVGPAVQPRNGNALLKLLEDKSSNPRMLQISMHLRKVLNRNGWLDKESGRSDSKPEKSPEPEAKIDETSELESRQTVDSLQDIENVVPSRLNWHSRKTDPEKKKELIEKKTDKGIAALGLPQNIAQKLSKKFGSEETLKKASDEDISSIPGIGKKILKQIRESLK